MLSNLAPYAIVYLFALIVSLVFVQLITNLERKKSIKEQVDKHFVHTARDAPKVLKQWGLQSPFLSRDAFLLFTYWIFIIVPLGLAIAFAFISLKTSLYALVLYYFIATIFYIGLRLHQNQQKNKFLTEFPQVIDAMVHDLEAGRPVLVAIQNVSANFPKMMGQFFKNIYNYTELGFSLPTALQHAAEFIDIKEFSFFTLIITVHYKTGSNPAKVLSELIQMIHQEQLIKKKVSSLSSDGRISAIVLGILPLLAFAVMYNYAPRINQEDTMMMYLFTEPAGQYALLYAAVSYLIGMSILYKISKVKV